MGANYANLFEVVAGEANLGDGETRISELCGELEAYLEPAQVEEIYSAYLVGAEAHDGQIRVSGEPYISHPVAVARILAEMRIPPNYGQTYTEKFMATYSLLTEQYGVVLLPFLLESVALEPGLMQADGIHPSIEAQPVLAEKVWAILEPELQ